MNQGAADFEQLQITEAEEQSGVSLLAAEELSLIGGGQVVVNTV